MISMGQGGDDAGGEDDLPLALAALPEVDPARPEGDGFCLSDRCTTAEEPGLRKLTHFIAASIDGFIGALSGDARKQPHAM
jgi:hypothetical protein